MRRCFKQKCIQICFRNPIVKKEREKVRLPPDRCPTSVVEREDKSALVLSEAADIDGILDVLQRTSIQRIRPNEHPRGDRSGEQAGPAACRAFKDGVNSAEECRIKKKKEKEKNEMFSDRHLFFFCCVKLLLHQLSGYFHSSVLHNERRSFLVQYLLCVHSQELWWSDDS